MAKGYILSEDDVKIIRGLVSAEVGRVRNTSGRAGRELDDIQAPDVYVAKTPIGGIPGLTVVNGVNDLPGSAECDIYQLVDDINFDAVEGLSKLVFNLSDDDIEEDIWTIVLRDKFGNWYIMPSIGGGASAAHIARVPADGIPGVDENATGTSTSLLNDDIFSFETCKVYRLVSDSPVWTGISVDVYNLSKEDIPGDIWIMTARDAYGTWVAESAFDEDTDATARCYIARAPYAGIAAMDENDTGTSAALTADDVVSSATCGIYRIAGSGLIYQGFSKTVYNLNAIPVGSNKYMTIHKDRYGLWLVACPGFDFGTCS